MIKQKILEQTKRQFRLKQVDDSPSPDGKDDNTENALLTKKLDLYYQSKISELKRNFMIV